MEWSMGSSRGGGGGYNEIEISLIEYVFSTFEKLFSSFSDVFRNILTIQTLTKKLKNIFLHNKTRIM